MSAKKQINIYLPEELYPKLKQLANCWGESVNRYLNWRIRCDVQDFEQLNERRKSLGRAEPINHMLCYRIDQTCHLEYSESIPPGGDECDLEWEWLMAAQRMAAQGDDRALELYAERVASRNCEYISRNPLTIAHTHNERKSQ